MQATLKNFDGTVVSTAPIAVDDAPGVLIWRGRAFARYQGLDYREVKVQKVEEVLTTSCTGAVKVSHTYIEDLKPDEPEGEACGCPA